ncbi:MAG: PqqD family protein [Ruminococcus sp.]|nr:PqqD family protein [Ruminococcus sp.]
MKLNDGFITHQNTDEHITVTTGSTKFNGIIRSNKTAGFILECLKNDTTKEQIISKMLEKYDAPKDVIEKDIDAVLEQLRSIGAIDD